MPKLYTIVEPVGESWQVATINGVECHRLDPKLHSDIIRPAWATAANKPPILTGKTVLVARDVRPLLAPGEAETNIHDGGVINVPGGEVLYTWGKERKSSVPFKAAWKVERDKLLSAVRTAAETARMRFLTAGDGKALTYEAKRQEAERWAAEASPRTLAGYRFALREAAALNDLDPLDDDDLATITELQVQAVIDVYTARSTAFQVIGAQIEALEQGATATIETQHDAAMAAYDANASADLSGYLAAMNAAADVDFPQPA
ncbi:hypothetical protein [Thalassobaculum sp.]|uniref:hypothetical protein n=1 Tax=Thalassobaculum sp. TaxID=2022740 RepID=UPI0032EE4AE3